MEHGGFLEVILESKATVGGVGTVLALALMVAAWFLLPHSDRGKLRLIVTLFIGHVLAVVALGLIPPTATAHAVVSVLGLFILLIVITRTGFVVFADSGLLRRWVNPLPKIIRDIFQSLIYIAVLLITLRAAGVDPSSLLTTSALLTAVIGLSLQETLGNMFAGLAIQAQEPFRVGDWIQLDDSERLVGRVLEINWRSTKLFTNDETELIVPNGVISKSSIRNFTRPTESSRLSVRVQAPYDVPPARVREAILGAIRDLPEVSREPAPTVVTEDFADHGVAYWVRFFMNDFQQRHRIESLVRERIWYAFAREEISIPYPIRVSYAHDAAATRAEQEAKALATRRRALEHVGFLRALSPEALDELASMISCRLYGAGETVIKQGTAGEELYVIERGEVEVLHETGDPKKPLQELARLGPGGYFGEMTLLTGEPRSATVRASTEVELVVVEKSAFQRIIANAPGELEQISTSVAERQAELKANVDRTIPGIANMATDSHVLLKRIRRFFSVG